MSKLPAGRSIGPVPGCIRRRRQTDFRAIAADVPELKQRLAKADVEAGARFFERKCSQCHDAENRAGISRAAPVERFRPQGGTSPDSTSPSMKRSGHVWNHEALDYYLADTETAVPGRAMNFIGIDDARFAPA